MSAIISFPEVIIGALKLTIGFEIDSSEQAYVVIKAFTELREFKCQISGLEYKKFIGCNMPENIIAAGKLYEMIKSCQYNIDGGNLQLIGNDDNNKKTLNIPEILDIDILRRQVNVLRDEVTKLKADNNGLSHKLLGRVEIGHTTREKLFDELVIKFTARHYYTALEFHIIWTHDNSNHICPNQSDPLVLTWPCDAPKQQVLGRSKDISMSIFDKERAKKEKIYLINVDTVAGQQYNLKVYFEEIERSSRGGYVYANEFKSYDYQLIELYQRM